MSWKIKLSFILLCCALLAACESLRYYGQAVNGQLYILTHRQSIAGLMRDTDTEPALKARLATIERIRAFAATKLRLPLGSHYSTYLDLQRPYVVWNVFAAPEFSLQPYTWCYPVAGCVSYRGYFKEQSALDFAATLTQQGYDVFVGGVAAYSTLGWFSDPVLNTIINRDEPQLAALIFHELAHQVIYIPGETEFNESFATTVERAGLQYWLESADTTPQIREELAAAIRQELARQQQFIELVQGASADLRTLYAQPLADQEKRRAKEERITRLRDDYVELKAGWQGYGGYDEWFARDLNNAQLGTVGTYNSLVPAFNALLNEVDNDFQLFYHNVRQLRLLDPAQRQQRLQGLMAQ